MKIKTLGTSHGDPTKLRFNSSNIISEADNYYIVDAGVPVNALLIRENIELKKIRCIFSLISKALTGTPASTM